MLGGSYNPGTDEISGVEPYTWGWWHERRHQIQYNNELVLWIDAFFHDLAQQYGFYISIGLFIVEGWLPSLLFLGVSTVPYGLWNVLLEVDAWIYALKKKRF